MRKVALTAIIPAVNGCNLHCPGCFIEQREEAVFTALTEEDYVRFIGEAVALPEVTSFSLQGFEPLLPDAWPLARKLLHLATDARTPEGEEKRVLCVTNGTYLRQHADELVTITDNLNVSIDSHDPVIHDASRGMVGAWSKTVGGIRYVRELFGEDELFADYLRVSSILYPGKVRRLIGMPALLKELGIHYWTISPLISVRKNGYQDASSRIRDNVLELAEQAKKYSLAVYMSDDLRQLENVGDIYQVLTVAGVERNHVVARLSPDSSFSIGREALSESSHSQKWDREEPPSAFLRRLVQQYS